MKTRTYFVGLRAQEMPGGHRAVFEYRNSLDFLSPEIISYMGERIGSKAEAKRKLAATKPQVLETLNRFYPRKHFIAVKID